MRGHTTTPLSMAWNSWSLRPAELFYLPLGLKITPVLYSTRARATSLIEPRKDKVRFGRHAVGNRLIEVETELAGTGIGFSAGAIDPFVVKGSWSASTLGEWGTRFWLTLAISAEGGETIRYDEKEQVALVEIDRRFLAVVSRSAPIQVTAHDSIEALRADFEENGYFYTATRGSEAPVIALRFNMEMMRDGGYGAAIADSAELAVRNARAALYAEMPDLPELHQGKFEGALDAVRDVVGWNTIWDAVNRRAYTAVTRIWNLGEFAVWYNDQTFAALLASMFDADLARQNMAVALAGATPQGNVACIVTSNDAWVDRSQPPHGGLVAWLCYQRTGERSMLEASFEALSRNQRWWRENRDPDGVGLISCGTSEVGGGLYKGTIFGARNETGMDNSTTHDEALYEPDTRTLSTFDLGLNCALALDAEMLSRMADVLGKPEEAEEFAWLAESSRQLIRAELWDEERKIFANRQRKGGFVRSLSPTSFYPLLCGAASEEQARHLLTHLSDPKTFGGDFILPNATRDDPAFAENVYWRGRIWPNVNFMVWLGLKRYGFAVEASALATKSYDLFMQSWREHRVAAENYNASTGEALDQGDTDPFYIWAALLPMMAADEISGFDPWSGWTISNDGRDARFGPFLSPVGLATVEISEGVLRIYRGEKPVLSTNLTGRLSEVEFTPTGFACVIDGPPMPAGHLTLCGLDASAIVGARLDDVAVDWSATPEGAGFDFSKAEGRAKLVVWHAPAGRKQS
ncbi:MGH1-like glycoside hydrolase domain-containing protein [Neorhizobium alkalisoli]|uniref:Putative isomerase n=1 Tax=Neorhizobium alkalisoli TaxID=528178 RepID=A0A561QQ17_9HYPH|nr:trehalase family glycosidase [Neorhizobium alkalisoli]TWF52402.1 putative isomerase [Neorhizobium alkalisoli]